MVFSHTSVHMIRHSLNYVSWKRRAEAAAEPQASAEREQYPDDHHHAGIPP